MTRPLPQKRKVKKKPEPDKFEAERKRAEQEKSGLEELWRRQVKRGVIV